MNSDMFDLLADRCAAAFSGAASGDPDCLRRYGKVVSMLEEMREAVKSGSYPRDYTFLPLLHYVERHMDTEEMYASVKALDKWYAENYREKGPQAVQRERMKAYLTSEGGLSEKRADASIAKLARHRDIYLEFAEYVNKREFPEEGILVCGYDAVTLHREYPLSPLGAYNYLIYLREMPERALADLEAGLPSKDAAFRGAQQKEEQPPMEEKTPRPEEAEQPLEEKAPQPEEAEQSREAAPEDHSAELLGKLELLRQAVAELQQSFDDKIAEDTHKNALFDNMHRELTGYQNGAMDKIVDTMALDIIQLVDSTKGHIRVYEKKEPTEENYKRLLRVVKGISEDLADILYRQSIEAYRVEGHEVDVRRQKIIQTVPVGDPAKDNLIAVRAADGYEKNGKVLRPERIKIFKYTPEGPAEKPEN